MKFFSENENDTFELGKKLASKLSGGEIILLDGDLGAGKTVLAKGICKGLNIKETVTSPTYTYLKEYFGKLKVNHFDLYRIEKEEDVFELDLKHYLYENAVCIIEWNKFKNLKGKIISVKIKILPHDKREIEINGVSL